MKILNFQVTGKFPAVENSHPENPLRSSNCDPITKHENSASETGNKNRSRNSGLHVADVHGLRCFPFYFRKREADCTG